MRNIDADAIAEHKFVGNKFVRNDYQQGWNDAMDAIIDNAPTIEPKRKFIRIITTYYPDDLICYEEYKGKPYFSIEYQENEETFVGFGTYNPDILSRYLRDYFIDRGD